MWHDTTATALLCATLSACATGGNGASAPRADGAFADAGTGDGATSSDGASSSDGAASGDLGGSDLATVPVDTLDGNRDRLLATYLAYLHAHPGAQSNGLDGAALGSVCQLWSALPPSDRDVFLTLTARMQGSTPKSDKSSMLAHVVRVYRVVGGQSATVTDPGSCGGGEYNRMIMSMDATLHAALVAANANKGAAGTSGTFDLADVPADSSRFWRDSHDIGGPHAPFDLSDETQDGAPRGQVQYFRDPTASTANAPLGRMDLTTLVDPLALEMDQDYDCFHNSNPSCAYTLYGPACAPESSQDGTAIYTAGYGDFEPTWKPTGC